MMKKPLVPLLLVVVGLWLASMPPSVVAQIRAMYFGSVVINDTTANALVVGGAPGATAGTGGVKAGAYVGTTVTTTGAITSSAGNVSDSVGTLDAVRDGGWTVPSQAAGGSWYASSGTQATFLAKGTALQHLRMNSGATLPEWAALPMTLIKEGAGTSTDAGATNVDTFAFASTITIKDALLIVVRHRNTGNAANVIPIIQNSTDGVTVSTLSAANNNYYTDYVLVSAQSTTLVGGLLFSFGSATMTATRSTFTTSYAGNVTIALRHGGVTAPDTWPWEWAIYRINGQ